MVSQRERIANNKQGSFDFGRQSSISQKTKSPQDGSAVEMNEEKGGILQGSRPARILFFEIRLVFTLSSFGTGLYTDLTTHEERNFLPK